MSKRHGKHVQGAKNKNTKTVEELVGKAKSEEGVEESAPADDDATQMLPSVSSDDENPQDDGESGDDADKGDVASDEDAPGSDDETQLIPPVNGRAAHGAKEAPESQGSVNPAEGNGRGVLPGPAYNGPAYSGAPTMVGSVLPGDPGAYVAAGIGELPSARRRRGLKVFGITLGIIVGILLIAYLAGAVVFMGRFLPNTSIGGKDISLESNEEVAASLNEIVKDYRLDVVGSGFSYRLTNSDIGLSIDADGIVKSMHEDLNSWKWPLLILQPSHDETAQLVTSYQRSLYEPGLKAELAKYNETAKDPVNATIVFDAGTQKFVVKPEEAGTKLNEDAVLAVTAEAIDKLAPKAAIDEKCIVQPTVLSTDEKLKEAAELASGMVSARLTLIMGGQTVGTVDGAALSEFVTINDQFEVTFKEEEMNAWVENMANGFNTVGTERVYTRPDGKVIAVSGGVYGWEVDSEALKNAILEGIRAGKVGEIEVPCSATAAVYNGPNQPDWGTRYIDVDISEQYVRFYGEDGAIIWEAPCISGSPDGQHDTGRGVWTVNAKESPSKLIGYENGKKIYETMVTYWMPFEGNGIGFHDATWQPSFGGSMYANGYGSHGCVNLSYSDAQSLYGIIDYGDVVIVHS